MKIECNYFKFLAFRRIANNLLVIYKLQRRTFKLLIYEKYVSNL